MSPPIDSVVSVWDYWWLPQLLRVVNGKGRETREHLEEYLKVGGQTLRQLALPLPWPPPGVMKMRDKEEQLTVLAEQIFVPAGADESGEIRGVEEGSETVYSSVERVRREAAPYGSSEREDLPESATQTGQIL